MSYRNITVDGVDYKYTIGKTHVKVRGLGVWPKADLGEIVVRQYSRCEGWEEKDVYTFVELEKISKKLGYTPETHIRVRPSAIASKIRETIRLNT